MSTFGGGFRCTYVASNGSAPRVPPVFFVFRWIRLTPTYPSRYIESIGRPSVHANEPAQQCECLTDHPLCFEFLAASVQPTRTMNE